MEMRKTGECVRMCKDTGMIPAQETKNDRTQGRVA